MKIVINVTSFKTCDIYILNKKIYTKNSFDEAVIFLIKNKEKTNFIVINVDFYIEEKEKNIIKSKFIDFKKTIFTNYLNNELEVIKNVSISEINDSKDILYVNLDDSISFYSFKHNKLKLIKTNKLNSDNNSLLIEENNYAINKIINIRKERENSILNSLEKVTISDLIFGYLIKDKLSVFILKYIKVQINKELEEIIQNLDVELIVVKHNFKNKLDSNLINLFFYNKYKVLEIRQRTINVGKVLINLLGEMHDDNL